MKKLLTVLVAALALCVPAFADNESFAAGSIETFVNGISSNVFLSTDPDHPVYFWLEYSSDQSQVYTNAISLEPSSPFSTTLSSSGLTFNYTTDTLFTTIDGQGIYVSRNSVGGSVSQYTHSPELQPFPFNSPSVVGEAFLSYLENSGSTSVPSTFTVPCGNVLYFKVDREQDVTFTAVMPVLSSLLGTPTGAWNSGIQYGPAASLPTSGTTFPILSQDPINFAKTVSNQNLLGQTKNAISTKHCIAGQYYALYLPYHYGGWLALGSSHVYPDGSTSGGIVGANVTVSGSFAEIKVYPLTEKANGDLLTGSVTLDSGSDDGFASYFDGEISETGTVTWLDQNGDISSPSVGGTSYVPEDVSTESIIDQIKNILSSIVSEIKNLFSFGYEAVNTLVGLMRDFVSVFQQLYEWLPSEVYSALISAIIVAITIGVFKVFL